MLSTTLFLRQETYSLSESNQTVEVEVSAGLGVVSTKVSFSDFLDDSIQVTL